MAHRSARSARFPEVSTRSSMLSSDAPSKIRSPPTRAPRNCTGPRITADRNNRSPRASPLSGSGPGRSSPSTPVCRSSPSEEPALCRTGSRAGRCRMAAGIPRDRARRQSMLGRGAGPSHASWGVGAAEQQEPDQVCPDPSLFVAEFGQLARASPVECAGADAFDQRHFGGAEGAEPRQPPVCHVRVPRGHAPKSGCPCGNWSGCTSRSGCGCGHRKGRTRP